MIGWEKGRQEIDDLFICILELINLPVLNEKE